MVGGGRRGRQRRGGGEGGAGVGPSNLGSQRSHFGKHFYSLPRISRQAPAREQRQPRDAPVRQGDLAMNFPARPITDKLALTLAASLLTGVAFLPPSATAPTSPASGSHHATSASGHNRGLRGRVATHA